MAAPNRENLADAWRYGDWRTFNYYYYYLF